MIQKLKLAFSEFLSQEANLHRSSLSYTFLLAIFPTLIVIVIMFQNQLLDMTKVTSFIYHYLPEDIMEPFVQYILEADYSNIYTVVITLATTIFLSSRSFYTFMLISANKENFVTRAFLIRIKAIIVFVLFVVSLGAMALLFHYFPIYSGISLMITMFFIFYAFYRVLSFEVRPLKYGSVGALFTTIGVSGIGTLFLSLVHALTRYQTLYGPLASILIMMLSIHVLSGTIYFGYCLNHAYDYRYEKREYKHLYFYMGAEKIYENMRNIFNK